MFDESSYVNLARQVDAPFAGDERLYVEFRVHPMLNSDKSTAEGRPIYDDVEFIRILTPGDKDIYFQPATEQEKRRFRKQYEDFKANRESAESGTPLALLPGMTDSVIAEYAYFKVKTIEALASVSDAVAVRMPGTYEWRRKAQAYVAAAKEAAPLVKVRAELEQRDGEIAALREQLKTLAEQVAATTKNRK